MISLIFPTRNLQFLDFISRNMAFTMVLHFGIQPTSSVRVRQPEVLLFPDGTWQKGAPVPQTRARCGSGAQGPWRFAHEVHLYVGLDENLLEHI